MVTDNEDRQFKNDIAGINLYSLVHKAGSV